VEEGGKMGDYLAKYGIILFMVCAYMVLTLYIGYYFKKAADKGVSEYYVAKREIPGWVVALAFYSTFISTNTYIGQAGDAFRYGLTWIWQAVIWTIFCIISWHVMGPRLRNQTAKLGSITLPDYFDFRYQSSLSKPIRVLAAVIIIFSTVWYMVAIAKGCAHLLESILAIPYVYGAALIIGLTTLYTMWGGMYGVLWTDAMQGVIMFVVAILMAAIPFIYVGGFTPVIDAMRNTPHLTAAGKPFGTGLVEFGALVAPLYVFGIAVSVGIKQIAEPRCLIRFYSIKDTSAMKTAMLWTPILMGVSLICVFGLGAYVHAMVTPQEAAMLIKKTDTVVGFMLAKFDNVWVSSICMVGLFAAGMSSLASVTLIVGTALVRDIRNVLGTPLDTKGTILWTKATMMLYSLLVFIITIKPPAGIVELTAFSGAIFGASYFPAVYGGLYLRWGTGHGAFYSMLIGLFTCVFWRYFVRFSVPGMRNIQEIIPAFIASFVAYIIISKMTQAHLPPKEKLEHLLGPES
jgi:Na+/pantothenate symporter